MSLLPGSQGCIQRFQQIWGMVEAQQYYEAQKCKGGGGKCPSLSIQALLFGRYRDRAVRSTVDLGVSVRQCQKTSGRSQLITPLLCGRGLLCLTLCLITLMVWMALGPLVCLIHSMASTAGRSGSISMASSTSTKHDRPRPSVQLWGKGTYE